MDRNLQRFRHGGIYVAAARSNAMSQPQGWFFVYGDMTMEQANGQNRRGESIMLTFRFPKSLYEALPVKPAPNAGVSAGRSGYLRRLLVEAVERDLAAAANAQTA